MGLSSICNAGESRSTRPWPAILAVLTVFGWPLGEAAAQDMSFDLEEAETAGAAEEEAPAEEAPSAEIEAEASVGGDVLSELAAAPEEEEEAAPEREHHTLVVEEIYAVQRIYALRNGRFELAPSVSFTMNDQYVSHTAPAIALNYWVTNVLAIGANFLWYQGFESESDLNFHIRRSTRLAVPITQYQLGAHLNFTYVPIYGKFAMFNEYIFQWDSYVVGGVGMMRTRPVTVVDPATRTFDFDIRIAFNAGLGIRVFVTRYLTIFMELRDYMYLEKLENLEVALGDDRYDSSTWLDEDATLTHNVAAHIGMTIFFPFDFEYRYPK
jgi:outer membrane beta-barrel protein